MKAIRWMLLGALGLFVWQRYGQTGKLNNLPSLVSGWRKYAADLLDRTGRDIGNMLEGRSHAWSEKLRATNGGSKRIPIEGVD